MATTLPSSPSTLLYNLVEAGTKDQIALVQQLASLSPPITTAETLLSSKSRTLCKKLRTTSPRELDNLKTFISAELCALFTSSFSSSSEMFRSQGWRSFAPFSDSTSTTKRPIKLSSGYMNLDALLPDNGFPAHYIYEIVGPAAVGKSQICMSVLAAAATTRNEGKLLYIDTSGCVTHSRMHDMICHNFKRAYERSPSNVDVSEILSCIHVAHATDPWTCLNIISVFKQETDATCNNNQSNVVVIDSIHDLISPYTTEEMTANRGVPRRNKSSFGTESELPSLSMEPILAQIILLLRSLASTTIFITNLTYQDFDERIINDGSVVWMDGIDGSLLLWREAATTSRAMIRFMHTWKDDNCDVRLDNHENILRGEGKSNSSKIRDCLIDFNL